MSLATIEPKEHRKEEGAPRGWRDVVEMVARARFAAEHRTSKHRCSMFASFCPNASKVHPHLFYRDVVHANEYGEQILSKILLEFFRQ